VEAAGDGLAALKIIEQQPPDAILLDLMMPRLDGFGVIEQLQLQSDTQAIPIIVLTSKTLTNEETTLLQSSASRVIQKQVLERKTLIQELEHALQQFTIAG
jgi:CheY-like chemotaxis protein